MDTHRARPHRTRVLAVGGLALVAVLGNMRPAVSETTPPQRHGSAAAVPAVAEVAVGRIERAPLVTPVRDASSPDGRFASEALQDSDDASLVPAIFAWDPDVRYVYFRHVSKWM